MERARPPPKPSEVHDLKSLPSAPRAAAIQRSNSAVGCAPDADDPLKDTIKRPAFVAAAEGVSVGFTPPPTEGHHQDCCIFTRESL